MSSIDTCTDGQSLYNELPKFVTKIRDKIGVGGKGSTSNHFVKAFLFQHVDSTDKDTRADEVKFKTLYLNQSTSRKRGEYRPYKKRKNLTSKEKKELKIHEIPESCRKYEMYEPMVNLWQDYMNDVVDFSKYDHTNLQKLEVFLKIDYHGCVMKVTKSKCPQLVGIEGIMIQETKNTFKLITKDDKIKTVPKKNSVFSYELSGYEFSIYGNQFLCRAGVRSTYKFGKPMKYPLSFYPL